MSKTKISSKSKESQHRSKIKKEREARQLIKLKKNQNKKVNQEFFELIKRDNLDNLTKENKLEIQKKIYTLIMSYTQQNTDKIELLFVFCEDKSLQVVIQSLKFLRKIFMDIIPNYKIRKISEKEQKTKVSKEVDDIHKFESNLIKHYQKFINILSIFSKYKKKNNEKKVILQKIAVKIIADLFEKFYMFNFSNTLYSILITKLDNPHQEIREISFKSLREVLSINDNSKNCLELKFHLIKLICHMFFNKPHSSFSPDIIDLLVAHKVDFPELAHEKRKKKALEKQLGEDVKKELKEVENMEDNKIISEFNLKILKKVLLVYCDILKFKRDSIFIKNVFNGIGKLSDNINIEILLDLQKNIYDFIDYLFDDKENTQKNKDKTIAVYALKTCLSISEKLTKEIISIDDTNLSILCFTTLKQISYSSIQLSIDEFYSLLEVLDAILVKNRQFSIDVVASFVKIISIFLNSISVKVVPAFLLFVKIVLLKYPSLSCMLEDEDFDGFSLKINDPSLTNAKQSNIVKEISLIKDKYKQVDIIRQLTDFILKGDKKNSSLASLSYFDLLLNLSK
jgi:hypothetical protein